MLSEINMKAVASHHHERMRWVVVAIDDLAPRDRAGKRSDFYFPTFMHPGGKECHAQ